MLMDSLPPGLHGTSLRGGQAMFQGCLFFLGGEGVASYPQRLPSSMGMRFRDCGLLPFRTVLN